MPWWNLKSSRLLRCNWEIWNQVKLDQEDLFQQWKKTSTLLTTCMWKCKIVSYCRPGLAWKTITATALDLRDNSEPTVKFVRLALDIGSANKKRWPVTARGRRNIIQHADSWVDIKYALHQENLHKLETWRVCLKLCQTRCSMNLNAERRWTRELREWNPQFITNFFFVSLAIGREAVRPDRSGDKNYLDGRRGARDTMEVSHKSQQQRLQVAAKDRRWLRDQQNGFHTHLSEQLTPFELNTHSSWGRVCRRSNELEHHRSCNLLLLSCIVVQWDGVRKHDR